MRNCSTIFLLVACVAGLLVSIAPTKTGAASAQQSSIYRERTLAVAKHNFSDIGLRDCPSVWALDTTRDLAVCRAVDSSPRLRLFLLDMRRSGQKAILFRSPDFQDAYYVKVTMFGKDQDNALDFVLAEYGAEFSYGVRVYRFDGAQLHFVGEIGEVLGDENNFSSVVPALQITGLGHNAVFSFTKPVMLADRAGNYHQVSVDQVRYVLDGPKLRRQPSVEQNLRSHGE